LLAKHPTTMTLQTESPSEDTKNSQEGFP
jgi:hypothetical protein